MTIFHQIYVQSGCQRCAIKLQFTLHAGGISGYPSHWKLSRSQRQGCELLFKILISTLDINNIIHKVIPSAASPAITSAAPARRSGALTLAPVSFFTPSMIAELPSTLIQAPIRESSSAYLKRFSKILSVTILVPSASARVTAICGCISVGYPGYGSVFT